MTPVPLDRLGIWGWQNHKSALWWLFLLYRRPRQFSAKVADLAGWTRLGIVVPICWHAMPYVFVICVLGRLLLFGVLGLPMEAEPSGVSETLLFHGATTAYCIARGIALGIAVGIALGIAALGIGGGVAFGIALGIAAVIAAVIAAGISLGIVGASATWSAPGSPVGIAGGYIAAGIAVGITLGIAGGIARGTLRGIGGGVTFGIRGGVAVGNAMGIAAGIVVGIGGGSAFGIAVGVAVATAFSVAFGTCWAISSMRAFYCIPHLLFVWPQLRGTWYRYHPVAWDDLCLIPLWRLDLLLAAYAELSPEAGDAEIERLINEYPAQRTAALRARTILLAREAAGESRLVALDGIAAKLPEGDKRFLKQVPRVRQMVGELSGLQARLDTIDRPFLGRPYAEQLATKIENFKHTIAGFDEPLRTEFRAAADKWLEIAKRQLEEVSRVVQREPTHQLFRAGDPVQRDREAFVPRYSVVGELEQQVTLSSGCPGLILYGRRRRGKSTLQANLRAFLPDRVSIATLSMQNPEVSTSVELLAGKVAEVVEGAVETGCDEPARPGDLKGLFGYLSRWDEHLAGKEKSLVIAVDEYEGIDTKIGEGVFSEDLLATLRESIQTHRQVIWMFAGTHEITELTHAPWTSYLVSLRTIEVPMFTPQETRRLLTEPMKYSTLWAKDDPRRPRFDPEFWGEGGIERIHTEAGGWPHLVQLIAETCVDLVNEEGVPHVDPDLYERALDKAVVRGHNVLYELLVRECAVDGEWEYVSAFRGKDTQPPPDDEAVHRSLRRRLLMAEEAGEWRLRVPLMARWLRERG